MIEYLNITQVFFCFFFYYFSIIFLFFYSIFYFYFLFYFSILFLENLFLLIERSLIRLHIKISCKHSSEKNFYIFISNLQK